MSILKNAILSGLLAASTVMGAAGCSQSNDRNWQSSPVLLMSAEAASSLPGRWEGDWQSNTNYDRGVAHITMVSIPAPADSTTPNKPHFAAHITLWHYDLLPEKFDIMISSTQGTDGKINFYGERGLDPDWGMEKFDGYVENNQLFLTFVSRRDYGTLSLRHLQN